MRPRLSGLAALLIVTLLPAAALAQTTVRVTVDRASIWRPGFMSVVAVVDEGTELDVVGRTGDWLEVVVPAGSSEDRRTGLISLRQVTLATGTLPEPGTSTAGAPTRPAFGSAAAQQRTPLPPAPPLDTGVRGFADVSYHLFTARETFEAVIDQPGGVFFGGGGEVRIPGGLFVQGSVRWFRRTGERVFVFEDEVFPLGIENEITITPIAVTAGFRFRSRGAIPYVGGGAGTYRVKEIAEFADPTEDIDESFTSYHVLAGAEIRTRSWFATAVEVQYTLVPDSLSGGLAEAFDERDLGGLDIRFKVVFGR